MVAQSSTEKMQQLKTKSKLTRTNIRTQQSLRLKEIEREITDFFLRIRNQSYWRPSNEIKLYMVHFAKLYFCATILLHAHTARLSCPSNKVKSVQWMIIWFLNPLKFAFHMITATIILQSLKVAEHSF